MARRLDWDLDDEIRNELERDVQQHRDSFGDTDVVLVTGDIAFRGAKDEYDLAYDGSAAFVV